MATKLSAEPSRWRRWLASPTLHRLGELALTHTATFAFPLVFAVVCGRVLGVHEYGVVAFYTALAAFLGMFVEFGFNWYGVREVASQLDQPQRCHRVLVHITAAKLLLGTTVICLTWVSLLWWRGVAEWPLMLAWSGYMVGFALEPAWYLQAHERTRVLLAVTSGTRIAGIALMVTLITTLATTQSALWSYAVVSISASTLLWAALFRYGLARRTALEPRYVLELLKGSWPIVVGNLNGSLLTNGGVALLGLTAEPATVASANLALRVRMAAEGALLPLNQLGYVRLSSRAKESPEAAFKLGRKLLVANLVLAVLLASVCMLAAPAVTQVVFKHDVPLAVALIFLLSLSLPLHTVAGLFGQQCLVALGREGRYALIQITASAVFCAVMLALASPQVYGWAVIAAELTVLLVSALTLMRMRSRLDVEGVAR